MKENEFYMVMRLNSSMIAHGLEANLPDGQYYVPVFTDYSKALEYSQNGKFKILVVTKEIDEDTTTNTTND